MDKVTGYALTHKGEHVEIGYDEDAIEQLGSTLSTNLLLNNDTLSAVVTKDELEECFCYALHVILAQDSGAKPSFEVVPKFMSDLIMSLSLKERNIIVRTGELSVPKRPHSYGTFLDVMSSMGYPVDKVLKVSPDERSRVLAIGECDLNDSQVLVGIDGDVSIEELIVRALLEVPEEQQAKLERIIGAYDHVYISKDEILRQWGVSFSAAR